MSYEKNSTSFSSSFVGGFFYFHSTQTFHLIPGF